MEGISSRNHEAKMFKDTVTNKEYKINCIVFESFDSKVIQYLECNTFDIPDKDIKNVFYLEWSPNATIRRATNYTYLTITNVNSNSRKTIYIIKELDNIGVMKHYASQK